MNEERVAAAARAAHRMMGLVHRLLLDWLSSLHSACLRPLQATRVAAALSRHTLLFYVTIDELCCGIGATRLAERLF